MTSHGWRPISVTSQPASVATQPEKVNAGEAPTAASAGRSSSGRNARSTTRTSISTPMPTITRKAKNTGATGGMSSLEGVQALHLAVELVREDERKRLTASRSRSRCARSPRWASRTAPAARRARVSQSASIAAIFAGWCSSVLRPCRSPTRICIGTSTAASRARRRAASCGAALSPRRACSSRHADSPATRNAAVMPEASSMCVRR